MIHRIFFFLNVMFGFKKYQGKKIKKKNDFIIFGFIFSYHFHFFLYFFTHNFS